MPFRLGYTATDYGRVKIVSPILLGFRVDPVCYPTHTDEAHNTGMISYKSIAISIVIGKHSACSQS